jgi:hypothetical protein
MCGTFKWEKCTEYIIIANGVFFTISKVLVKKCVIVLKNNLIVRINWSQIFEKY